MKRMKNYTLSLDVLKFGNFSKADSEVCGDGYFKHSNQSSRQIGPQDIVDALEQFIVI